MIIQFNYINMNNCVNKISNNMLFITGENYIK